MGSIETLELLLDLVHKAGVAALAIAAKPDFKVEYKSGELGPVTEADKLVNEILLEGIAGAFPRDLIVSEESPLPAEISSERIWYIDPIDGTMEFTRREPDWSIMIGLVEGADISMGVVYQPVTGQAWYAVKGQGAFMINRGLKEKSQLHTRVISSPKEAVLIQSRSHFSPEAQTMAKRLGITKAVQQGSVGLKLCSISSGRADLYLNFSGKCHLWDICAAEIILEEAGGKVCQLNEDPINYRTARFRVDFPFLAAAQGLSRAVAKQASEILRSE